MFTWCESCAVVIIFFVLLDCFFLFFSWHFLFSFASLIYDTHARSRDHPLYALLPRHNFFFLLALFFVPSIRFFTSLHGQQPKILPLRSLFVFPSTHIPFEIVNYVVKSLMYSHMSFLKFSYTVTLDLFLFLFYIFFLIPPMRHPTS